jgi:3-mercaptopyruvate sulfurtransferase SseA
LNKKTRLLLVISILSTAIFACNLATPAQAPPSPTLAGSVPVTIEPTGTASSQLPANEAEVPRVSVEDAAAAIKNGDAIVLDVRSAEAYQTSHIPGALSAPLFDIEKDPKSLNLDKDKWIITYCT